MRLFAPIALVAATALVACSNEDSSNVDGSVETGAELSSDSSVTVDENVHKSTIWPKIESGIQLNPEHEAKIDQWLKVMPLEHKVAQMVQGEIRHVTPEHVKKYRLGTVLNGGGSYPNQDRESSVADWLALADAYYEASMAPGLDYEPIPLIWGTDAVHGHNNVQGAILFPHNIGLGATRNPELLRRIGAATGQQVAATAIDWTFAPTVANAIDPRWGRTYESYGNDTSIISQYSAEIVKGLQGEVGNDLFSEGRLISTVKHFLGDGGTTRGVDQGNTEVDEQTLFNVHGSGYVGGLNAGAQTVMASFNSWNGEKIHGYKYLLTDVLKDTMGFDGFVVGDWNGHGQVEGCSNAHCPQSINAGVDVIMVPDDWEAFLLNTIEDVKQGRISEERVDDAVRRILRVKLRSGVFERGKPSSRKYAGDEAMLRGEGMRELARQAVEESLVLIKNDGVLPLKSGQKIYLAGNAKDDIQRQMGGWSVTWQGTETTVKDYEGATTIADAIAHEGVVVDEVSEADVVVAIFGEPPYAEFMGDRTHLIYSELDKESVALLEELKSAGKPVVSVFISGRPMWVNLELNHSNAFVAAWLPGYAGEGVANVLFAKDGKDFKGALPMPWSLGDDVLAMGQVGTYRDGAIMQGQVSSEIPKSNLQEDVVLLGTAMISGTHWQVQSNDQVDKVTNKSHSFNGVKALAVDHKVQEDAKQVEFANDGGQLQLMISEGVLNLSSWRIPNSVLQFDIKVDSIESDTTLTILHRNQLGEFGVDITEYANSEKSRTWQTIRIPLVCLSPDAGALSSTVMPFAIQSTGSAISAVSSIRVTTSEISNADCSDTWAGEGYKNSHVTVE